MNYYRLDGVQKNKPEYCTLKTFPEGILGPQKVKLQTGGQLLSDEYPTDPRIYMSETSKGIVVPDFVNNVCALIIVSRPVKEAMEANNHGPTQYLPIKIYNHRKRITSDQHFIANPIGVWDVLDLKASKIVRDEGKVVDVEGYVLDKAKLARAPDFFRTTEYPLDYFVSDRIVAAWKVLDPRPSNIAVFKVPLSG